MENDIVALTSQLIEKQSISPNDAGCQALLVSRLKLLGFTIEEMNFGDTHNFWAYRGKKTEPTVVFAGHTDVVPAGDYSAWQYDPFQATLDSQGKLYGRGACDMKSGLAAMICAVQEYLAENSTFQGRIGFLITSDEEASGENGTKKVVEALKQRNEHIDYCIVGEPTSKNKVGDQIKNGRRGSLIGHVSVYGKQGHIAYPHLAENPIHLIAPWLHELLQTEWDRGNTYFPATTFQIVNIHSGIGAENVIPGELTLQFGFRYGNELTDEIIRNRFEHILKRHAIPHRITWRLSGRPFLTPEGILTTSARQAIHEITQIHTELSTSGGTSDGRFIAELGCEIIELGPINATLHQVNEHVVVEDIITLKAIYQRILEKLFKT